MSRKIPSLNALKAFESAARLLSFKNAAEELSVSPTAISHQVRGLEDDLNVSLFKRRTRAIELTEAGKILAQTATKSFDALLDAVNDITCPTDVLTVGTTQAFASLWLVPNLADFHRQHADIQIKIIADDALTDIENNRQIDLTIRSGSYREDMRNTILLRRESLAFFATPAYWKTYKRNLTQATLFSTIWKNSALPGLDVQQVVHECFPRTTNITIQYFDDENHTIQAALSGHGIALASKMLVQTALDYNWLVQGIGNTPKTLPGLDCYCVVPERNSRHPAVRKLLNWLAHKLN